MLNSFLNAEQGPEALARLQRRSFLSQLGVGFGSIAASSMLARNSLATDVGLPAGVTGVKAPPHLSAKVKRVIFLYMSGGPSHLETFDYKPELDKLDGKEMPSSFTEGQPIAQLQGKALKVQGHLSKFSQYGENGTWISDFLPHHQRIADKICVVKSMVTEQINHDPAHTFMNTGTAISGRPSMGSWINYGLGSECDN
ncbi:MAG: DUF1501 domain-containing protein, partial [Planctomycetota bacterium]